MRGHLRKDPPGCGTNEIVVLKFGSSLLDGPGGYRVATEEIGREVADGHRVLAVVSARRGVTDDLLREARAVTDPTPDPSLVARLLRTGEEASVALLGLAARGSGLCVEVLGADELGLRTDGPVDEADPVGVDLEVLDLALRRNDVAIVPGFVGRDARGRPTLLGRGGSDYTALYLGRLVGATEIRLVKDVDGVFRGDPEEPAARPLARASWDEVDRVGGGVVQSRALRFAMREGLDFRVAAPGGRGTRVGSEVGLGRAYTGRRVPVAVLGATGVVGQRIVRMLAEHPWLRPAELVGSPRSAGEAFWEVVDWVMGDAVPSEVRERPVTAPGSEIEAPVVLSALPSRIATDLELRLAGEGRLVCTNASAHRMRPDVPLVVPEVNAGGVELLREQPWREAGGGLVANPNCVVTGLALALAPIERAFGLEASTVVTLQALSGAGSGGPAALAAAANVLPFIAGEEEKIPGELQKVLGAGVDVAVAVTRVPVVDGHTAHVFLRLGRCAPPTEVVEVLEAFRPEDDIASLPSIPRRPLVVRSETDRPQPRLDAGAGGGMTVSVGRIREAPPYDVALTLVVHNTVRGAAGACVANAELCLARGLVAGGQPAAT